MALGQHQEEGNVRTFAGTMLGLSTIGKNSGWRVRLCCTCFTVFLPLSPSRSFTMPKMYEAFRIRRSTSNFMFSSPLLLGLLSPFENSSFLLSFMYLDGPWIRYDTMGSYFLEIPVIFHPSNYSGRTVENNIYRPSPGNNLPTASASFRLLSPICLPAVSRLVEPYWASFSSSACNRFCLTAAYVVCLLAGIR